MPTAFVNRVPFITFSYWMIKIAATTLGETGADHFSMTLNFGYGWASLFFLAVLLLLLGIKLTIKSYTPTIYWSVFTATSIAGTSMCDYVDRTLGIGYGLGSFLLFIGLLATLWFWYRSEHSIAVEKVLTTPAEIFYWAAFLVANTLGTAAGDYLAHDAGAGFALSAGIIGGLLMIIIALHFLTKVSSVLLFWAAFVLTRPFGATFGDLLTKPLNEGGFHFSTIAVSLLFVVILICLIGGEHVKLSNRKL